MLHISHCVTQKVAVESNLNTRTITRPRKPKVLINIYSLIVSFWDSNLSRYGHGGESTEVGIYHVHKTRPSEYRPQGRTLP